MQIAEIGAPQIKICGITRMEEASYLNEIHADYAGFVFWEQSRRKVSLHWAEEICKQLDKRIKRVAVTVSPNLNLVRQIEKAGFDILQVHGQWQEEVIRQSVLPVWRACNLHKPEALEKLEQQKEITGYVIDAKTAGSGKTFDWAVCRNVVGKMRDTVFDGKKFVLAGGLNAQNVTEAVELLQPDVVDVSSGVESAQGKSRDLVLKFSETVRNI